MSVTNRGKLRLQEIAFANGTFYLALVTNAITPGPDTNTLSQLTQIDTGTGYTNGGLLIAGHTVSEDDASDTATVVIDDVTWTATGGALEGGGDRARYAVLTDANVTVGNRAVIAFSDLLTTAQIANSETSIATIPDGQTLTVSGFAIRFEDAP